MAPTTAAVMGLPLMLAMRERYPDVRFHLVESLSGHLMNMLNARQLDLAIVFNSEAGRKWSVMPLLEERLFVFAAKGFKGFPRQKKVRLAGLTELPLVMPTNMHGLRSLLAGAIGQQDLSLNITMEIDSLAMLMDAVGAGLVATIQPGAAITRVSSESFVMSEISDPSLVRRNLLVSLSDDELSPAGLATRVVMRDVALRLVREGGWLGASVHES